MPVATFPEKGERGGSARYMSYAYIYIISLYIYIFTYILESEALVQNARNAAIRARFRAIEIWGGAFMYM